MINVYKASAGSGKTFTLVREYFKMVMGEKKPETNEYVLNRHINNAHRSVLAITFTNKATDEMKQRIIKELFTLSQTPKESDHLKYLEDNLHASETDIQKAASTVMSQILNDFTNFNVSTIDSFFQTILRTFAHESDIAGNYNVEINDDYAIAVGISDLKQSLRLKSKKENGPLIDWLSQFMLSKVQDGKSWNIFNDNKESGKKGGGTTLSSFAANLSKEIVKKNRDALNEYLSDRQKIKEFKDALSVKTAILKKAVKDNAQAIENISTNNGLAYKKNFTNLLNKAKGDFDYNSTQNLKSFLENYNDESKWFNKKESSMVSPEDVTKIRNYWEETKQCIVKIKSFRMIHSQLYFLGLLGDIEKNIRNYNTENNVLLLSDTNEILRKIINKEDAPFIYERVGVKLSHYLMDEFQDTSKMQWDNIKPLINNSLAEENDNLIIGDVKQSIYRFRNSDPKLLKEAIYKEFPTYIKEPNNGKAEANTNWRSNANVIKFNNTFFDFVSKNMGMNEVYSNVVQGISPKNINHPGHVKVEFITPQEQEKFADLALNKMLEDILDLLQRKYEQKDITILVNTNDEGDMVINKLLEYSANNKDNIELNVVSDESLRINKSASVKIILGVLSLLDNKASIKESNDENGDKNKKRKLPLIIKRINYNLSHEEDTSKAFYDAFNNQDNDLNEEFLNGAQDCAGLDAIVERIIKEYITPEMAQNDTAYIQAFQDYVLSYEQRFGSNLHMFLKWWNKNEHKCTITSPDNINAIKVITIHKSKGLEFPCVIIPFADWKFDKQGLEWLPGKVLHSEFKGNTDIVPPILPVKRETVKNEVYTLFDNEFRLIENESKMDSLNKTYVAFTRAVNELLIYTNSDGKSDLSNQLNEFQKVATVDNNSLMISVAQFLQDDKIELGEPTIKEEKKDKQRAENESMPDYQAIVKSETPKYKVPDQVPFSHDDPRFQGEVLHTILSKVNVKDDLDFAVRYFLSKGIYSLKESEKYRGILTKGFENKDCSQWFAEGNQLIKERTIINAKGEEYRPDRMVVTPDGKTIIIDYKFGKQHDKKYREQVKNYMNIIGECGYKNIEGYIWYIVEDEIVRL